MRCAWYGRKSTDDSDKSADARSTAHQREQCLALIEKNGWTLAEGHEYVDEATSGAVFNRPALLRMLEALKAKTPPFDALVAYDESRLGRDVVETGYLVKTIIDSGVRVFFADGSERKLDSATDALLMAISNFGGAFERERASVRVRDKMFAMAKQGRAVGARAFGYDSVEIDGHRELRVNERQAEIVREIFKLCADGFGVARIAHQMNARHRGVQKWSASGIRDTLTNGIYIGVVTYGRTMWQIKKGVKRKVAAPETSWLRMPRPELRIVPDALWQAAQARKAQTFVSHGKGPDGRLTGKPERSALASRHLLAGLLVCGTCFGKMVATYSNKKKTGTTHWYYVCWRHRSGGNAACTNAKGVPMSDLHGMMIEAIRSSILTPDRVVQVAKSLADTAHSPEAVDAQRRALVAEIESQTRKLAKLAETVAEVGGLKTLVTAIKAGEQAQRSLERQLAALDAAQEASKDWSADGRSRVEAVLKDWSAALEGDPVVARQILRKLLASPVFILPQPEGGWLFKARGTFDRLITGLLGGPEQHLIVGHQRFDRPYPGFEQVDPDVDGELAALVRSYEAKTAEGRTDAPGTYW